MCKMTKGRAHSEQSKTASLGTNTDPHRGSRRSRGDRGIDGCAVSGESVQTPFGVQDDGVLGGASGGGDGMAREEATTLRLQIPKFGICDESVDERAASYKHATTSWRCGFEWVAAVLRSRLRAWDVMVAKDCECSIDELYATPFKFKYVLVDSLSRVRSQNTLILCSTCSHRLESLFLATPSTASAYPWYLQASLYSMIYKQT